MTQPGNRVDVTLVHLSGETARHIIEWEADHQGKRHPLRVMLSDEPMERLESVCHRLMEHGEPFALVNAIPELAADLVNFGRAHQYHYRVHADPDERGTYRFEPTRLSCKTDVPTREVI